MPDLSLKAVVLEIALPDRGFSGYTYLACLLSNPSVRAEGRSEGDALMRLSAVVRSNIPRGNNMRVVDLNLDEMLVEEVMGS